MVTKELRGVGLTIALAAALAGCGKDEASAPVRVGGPCLPQFLAGNGAQAESQSANRVYLDGSLSMAGYIDAQTVELRPHGDILSLLPVQTTRYFSFGKALHQIQVADADRYASSEAYRCKGAGCDNLESRIDLVLQDIEAGPKDSLDIVVTDLWLSGGSVMGSPQVALGEPLAAILADGRAIGVLGVRAPYRGPVYDLPSGRTYSGASERPLFILIIGPERKVTAFKDRITHGGSPSFAESRIKYSLFTSAPATAVRAGAATPLHTVGAAAVAGAAVSPGLLPGVRQYRLSLGKQGGIEGEFDARLGVQDGAVWQGPLKAFTRVWLLRNEGELKNCDAKAWQEYSPLSGAWRAGPTAAPTTAKLRIDGHSASVLTPGRTYLIAAYLGSSTLTVPNPAAAWMREWSFDADQEEALTSGHPSFFKVLNLGDLATIMEQSLQRAAPQGQSTVVVPLVVKVGR